jgi:hypothetical protein
MSFEWLERTPMQKHGPKLRAQAATRELTDRAGTMFRLGFTQAQATQRLTARIAWEHEGNRHEHLSDAAVAKIVADTYARRPGGE